MPHRLAAPAVVLNARLSSDAKRTKTRF